MWLAGALCLYFAFPHLKSCVFAYGTGTLLGHSRPDPDVSGLMLSSVRLLAINPHCQTCWRGRLPEGFEHLDLAFRPLYPVELRETIGPRHYRQNGTVENPQPSRLAPPF
jgi:nanoRNase/pAp phosphatase (c-di-AMP/oligoRNAs hydrolase)